jgi:hypothetical protein
MVVESTTARIIEPPPGWPPLQPEALCGLAGEIVGTIDPYTEADRVSVLVQTLGGFGNVVGPGPHFRVEFTKHPARISSVLVGQSGKARKGQSWSTPRYMLTRVDPTWERRIVAGLSSGEGLIYAVRDPNPNDEDPGEPDKRLFVVEEEFARVLKVMGREGNTLSATMRDAWDHGNLHVLTKNTPLEATGAHISVVGHITQEELLRNLTATEQANGFANRFLWALVRRTKMIPNPTGVPLRSLDVLIDRLAQAVAFARDLGEMTRDQDAQALWNGVYPVLSEGKPGLLGAVLNRAEAQVLRLSLLYALLDLSPVVRPSHLKAALALWDYVEASARWIFGAQLGDRTADRIMGALRERGELDQTDVYGLFQNHVSREEIDRALDLIQKLGLAQPTPEMTGGRPRIVWQLAK